MIRTEVTLTQTGNNAQSRYTTYDCVKRLIDLLVATTALLLLAPLMAVLAAVVKLTSPGPVFFTHVRLGRDGIEFHCYKFRTMVADAETVLARSRNYRHCSTSTSSWNATRASPASVPSCAAPAWTSCLSSTTC